MRLFLAVTPDDSCRAQLWRDMAALRERASGIRWVKPEYLHLTLAFIAEIDDAGRDRLVAAAGRVVARVAPFRAELSGGGAFPGWKEPRVIWVGLTDPLPMSRLGSVVGQACAGVGYPQRVFTPHLTVGRASRPLSTSSRRQLAGAIAALRGSYPFGVTRVDVVRSELKSGGPHHTLVGGLDLGLA